MKGSAAEALDSPRAWIDHTDAIADAMAFLLAGEPDGVQVDALARLIAIWVGQFAPPTFLNMIDPDIIDHDAAMSRLFDALRRAEYRVGRDKWMKSAQ